MMEDGLRMRVGAANSINVRLWSLYIIPTTHLRHHPLQISPAANRHTYTHLRRIASQRVTDHHHGHSDIKWCIVQ